MASKEPPTTKKTSGKLQRKPSQVLVDFDNSLNVAIQQTKHIVQNENELEDYIENAAKFVAKKSNEGLPIEPEIDEDGKNETRTVSVQPSESVRSNESRKKSKLLKPSESVRSNESRKKSKLLKPSESVRSDESRKKSKLLKSSESVRSNEMEKTSNLVKPSDSVRSTDSRKKFNSFRKNRPSLLKKQESGQESFKASTSSGPEHSLTALQKIQKWMHIGWNTKELRVPFESTSVANISTMLSVSVTFATGTTKLVNVAVNEGDNGYNVKCKLETKTKVKTTAQMLKLHSAGVEEFKDDRMLVTAGILHIRRQGVTLKMQEMEQLRIKVRNRGDNTQLSNVICYPNQTVREVKYSIAKGIRIPATKFMLYLSSKTDELAPRLLEDAQMICDLGLTSSALIDVTEKHFSFDSTETVLTLNEFSRGTSLDILDQPDSAFTEMFTKMTDNLTECNCYELRMEALANFLMGRELVQSKLFLSGLTAVLHHRSCLKSKNSNRRSSSVSFFQDSPSVDDDEPSGVSMEDYIHAELERVEKKKKTDLDEEDYSYLVTVTNFRSFKRYLRTKIGTEVNLRSVTLLYRCARGLVDHIDSHPLELTSTETMHQLRRRMLDFIKIYFKKYFEKAISDRGGLVALTLTDSDVEN